MENDLFELLGESNFDFILEMVQHRQELLDAYKVYQVSRVD